MARIVVAFDTVEGQTRKIADYIGESVRGVGHEVIVLDVEELANNAARDGVDGFIIGASIHLGKHSPRFVEFVTQQKSWLNQVPVAFFSVSLSASGADDERRQAQTYVEELLAATGWKPRQTATVAGGLQYRKYGFLKRIMMKSIAQKGGHDTDTSRDHEYTDWGDIDQFTVEFLRRFAAQN